MGSRREAAFSWKELGSDEVGSNLNNMRPSCASAAVSHMQTTEAIVVMQIKIASCAHGAVCPGEGSGPPHALGSPSNLQPPTQALHYKSQYDLGQELDLAPGRGQRCPGLVLVLDHHQLPGWA